jgi:uncharacterized protein (UPF0332 family)
MFHACRALLFKDGCREKSHYCVTRYIEEKYVSNGKLDRIVVDLLFRELRHRDLYELDFSAMESDVEESIKNAKLVIKCIEKLIS